MQVDFLISNAYAQAGAGGQGSPFPSFIILGGFFVLMYFLLIRPQQKRQKEHKGMIENLSKGDEVITQGGLLGKITKLADSFVVVEIASGTEIKLQKIAITAIMPKGTIKSI